MLGSDSVRRDESSPNITGVAYSSAELARGWLSLLKEIRPLSRVAGVSGADPPRRAELLRLPSPAANAGARLPRNAVQNGDPPRALLAGPPADRPEAVPVPGGRSRLG